MFKVTSLTNVRPTKTENPEVSTTPTDGNIKINAPGAKKLGVTLGDYIVVVSANDEENAGIYIAKGSEGNKEQNISNIGAKLSSPTNKSGGNLVFSSGNAYKELGGVKTLKKVYSIADEPIVADGVSYYKLTYVRDEIKAVRTEKENTVTQEG